MKKIIAFLVAGLALAGTLFAEAPAFTDESAYVIDTTALSGTMRDNVKLTNVSAVAANFDVTVFAYDEGASGWVIFGKGHLKGLGDVATVKSINKKLIKLADYKYIAIKPSADNPFRYSSAKGGNDLNVWFYDDREIDESHFKTFDITMLPPFSDNLRLVGGETLKNAASFKIYAYDDEDEESKAGTVAVLKGAKDKVIYPTTNKGQKYNLFHYIKIISREEKDFKYTVNVERNDLVITVSE